MKTTGEIVLYLCLQIFCFPLEALLNFKEQGEEEEEEEWV